MSQVITRISPSPTGNGLLSSCHAGLARTALFNWAYARRNSGKFILRIEDTDQKRSTKESEQGIINDLSWLGINWDEGPNNPGKNGPYRQSERLDIYNSFIDKLLKEDKAYEEDGCVKIRFQHYGKTHCHVDDMILGKVEYPNESLKDLVIKKSDGFPTYHFAVVVDDALMGITHVFRAQEHLANTPKHILIQKALGFNTPKYAHMPIILNQDGSKMSKRQKTDDINIGDFKRSGYLPQALVNYLAMLGWSPKDKTEIFDSNFLIKNFDILDVKKSNAKFDYKKLQSINGKHLSLLDEKEFVKQAHNHLSSDVSIKPKNISVFRTKANTFGQITSSMTEIHNSINNINQIKINDNLIKNCYKDVFDALDKNNEWNTDIILKTINDMSTKNNLSINNIHKAFREAFPNIGKNITIDVVLSSLDKEDAMKLIKSLI